MNIEIGVRSLKIMRIRQFKVIPHKNLLNGLNLTLYPSDTMMILSFEEMEELFLKEKQNKDE